MDIDKDVKFHFVGNPDSGASRRVAKEGRLFR